MTLPETSKALAADEVPAAVAMAERLREFAEDDVMATARDGSFEFNDAELWARLMCEAADVIDRLVDATRPSLDAEAVRRETVETAAARDVLAERRRQVDVKGWTPEHDDKHQNGEMARAASCYADMTTWDDSSRDRYGSQLPPFWPWESSDWKPKDRRRDLVRAGALIIAEIERLDRALPAEKETER